MKFSPVAIIRFLACLALLILALFSERAVIFYKLCVAVSALWFLLYIIERPRSMRLMMFMQLGFILLVCREGIFNQRFIVMEVGPHAYAIAARYLAGVYAAVLLGYLFVFRETEEGKVSWLSQRVFQPGRYGFPVLIIWGLYGIFLASQLNLALASSTYGRNEAFELYSAGSVFDSILLYLGRTIGLVLPAIITYHMIFLRKKPLALAIMYSAPIFLIQVLLGSRFPLLFSFLGMVLVGISRKDLSVRLMFQLSAFGVVLILLAATMSTTRQQGLANYGSSDGMTITSYFGEKGAFHYENTVLYMAKIVNYFNWHEHLNGQSSTVIFFFWIPRRIWPGKPTFLGYWFPRAYHGISQFSSGHSVALTFAGDAYVDFGRYGGVLFWFFGGILLGYLERFCAHVFRNIGSPQIIFVASLFGVIYFGVRSFNTSIIQCIGIFFFYKVYTYSLNFVRVTESGPEIVPPRPGHHVHVPALRPLRTVRS